MTRPGRKTSDAPTDRGFVLIGVVMFVLALTILGLSLFSLSGYEASFLGDSRDATQAFYDASGGIDRARYMLVTRGSLQTAKDTLDYDGTDGVIYARARYADGMKDSVGPVDWSGARDIEVRTLAVRGGIRRMVECRFRPKPQADYYKRLITSTDSLVFDPEAPAHWPHTHLKGEAWLNCHNSSTWPLPVEQPSPVKYDGVIIPDLGPTYWNPRWAAAQEIPRVDVYGHVYNLDASATPGQVKYFKTTANPLAPPLYNEMSLVQLTDAPTISVSGYAVWMFDKGVNFVYGATVVGSPTDILVIVAKKGNRFGDTDAAVWFYGGLISENVRVVIVADGNVHIEQVGNGGNVGMVVNYLSIFNHGKNKIIGPGLNDQMLIHNAADDTGPHSPIDILYSQPGGSALPNPPSSQLDRLSRIAGTWREVTESNPL